MPLQRYARRRAATPNIQNYISTLEVAVSLGNLSPGAYSLAMRRDGNDWQQFPIRLE